VSKSFLENLNPAQKQAVEHTEGPLLVIAGAGSGKTRVLTYRVAYLIREKQVSPFHILAVTFTNKAANEMKERIHKLVGVVARDLWVGTFHNICGRILRHDIQHIGYDRNFVIYDEEDQTALMKEIIAGSGFEDKRLKPGSVLGRISQAKNQLIGPIEFSKKAEDFYEEEVALLYQRYQDRLGKLNALDFDDMLMLTVELFQKFPKVLEKYQDRFHYLNVDEYQDTNHTQYMLLHLLALKRGNLCVVGDDDQSIYAFRGADYRNILEFDGDYPKAHVIKLEQNYRSTQSILDLANSVIRNNENRKPKVLWTENPRGEKALHYIAKDEHDEDQSNPPLPSVLSCAEHQYDKQQKADDGGNQAGP
jgi:DNA helicase-2/ATP-dependent DNA helicase PcrA